MPKLKKKSYNQKKAADKNRKQELPKVPFSSTPGSQTQQGNTVPSNSGHTPTATIPSQRGQGHSCQTRPATIPATSQRGHGHSEQARPVTITGNSQRGQGHSEQAHPATTPATSQCDQNRQKLSNVPLSSTAGSQTQQGNTVPSNSCHTRPATIPSQRGQGHSGQTRPATIPATSQRGQGHSEQARPATITGNSQRGQGHSEQAHPATTLATSQSDQNRQKHRNVPLSSTTGSQTHQGNTVPSNSGQARPAIIPATSQRGQGHSEQAHPVTIPAKSQRSQRESGQACQTTIPDTSQRGQHFSAENVTTPLNTNYSLSIQPSGLHEQSFHGINQEGLMNGEMSVQIADYASHILKLQFNCHKGFFPPSYLYGLSMHPHIHLHVDIRIPRTIDAVQIHYAQGHFVVSHQINGRLFVYDSLHNFGHLIAIEKQLRILYENVKIQEIQ